MHKLDMQCDIYSTDKKGLFVFVKQGILPSGILPSSLIAELGELNHFKSKNITESSSLIGADPNDVFDGIKEYGYALQGIETKTNVSEVGAAIGAGILVASLGAALPITLAVSAASYVAAHLLKDKEEEEGEEHND